MAGDPCEPGLPDSELEPSGNPYRFWRASYFIRDEWARWDASIDSLLALSNEDTLALLDRFAEPTPFLQEHFSAAELRRLAFARWRLAGRDAANRQEWLPPA